MLKFRGRTSTRACSFLFLFDTDNIRTIYDIKASGTMTRDNATEKKPQNAECKEKFPGLHFKCGMPAMFVASERRGHSKEVNTYIMAKIIFCTP